MILREAISQLKPALKENHFLENEIDAHIYMFDRTTLKEQKLYKDCNAEAIIENGESKGFWIDKDYLNKASFADALETALHELCHKIGGDESEEFSYLLTDVNAKTHGLLLDDAFVTAKLNALKEMWNSVSKNVN
jgi:hypothetical protein